jgi:hypothetical protein
MIAVLARGAWGRRGRLRVVALAAATAALLVPAASASATSPPRGVLVALLRLEVGCGGPQVCTSEPQPFPGAHLEIRAVSRPLKLTVVSDETGRVSLRLRTGLYIVLPQAENAKAPKPVQVRVRAGRTTRIRLVYLRPKM